jgi:hypothetical protein
LESAEQRARVKARLPQRERRTGARFFSRSTAVRDDGLARRAQPLDGLFD